MTTAHVHQAGLSAHMQELVARACANYEALTPSQKLRHRYMQRRSFAMGMCPSRGDLAAHRANVEKRMPHEAGLTDAQIGLVLMGERPK